MVWHTFYLCFFLLTLTLRTNKLEGLLCRKYRENFFLAILVYAPYIFYQKNVKNDFFFLNSSVGWLGCQ